MVINWVNMWWLSMNKCIRLPGTIIYMWTGVSVSEKCNTKHLRIASKDTDSLWPFTTSLIRSDIIKSDRTVGISSFVCVSVLTSDAISHTISSVIQPIIPDVIWCLQLSVFFPFPLLVMCGSVGQTSHSILPLPTQQWWIPGGTKNWKIVNGISCRKCAEFAPEEMRPYKRVPIPGA